MNSTQTQRASNRVGQLWRRTVLAALGGIMLCSAAGAIASEMQSHIHVAVLFKNPGHEKWVFPATVGGKDIMPPLGDHADFIVITQTVGVRDGDVINIQNDVLRPGAGDKLEDFGVNCILSAHTQTPWTLGGQCKVILPNGKATAAIPPYPLGKDVVWYKVWEDGRTNTAIYFFKELAGVLSAR